MWSAAAGLGCFECPGRSVILAVMQKSSACEHPFSGALSTSATQWESVSTPQIRILNFGLGKVGDNTLRGIASCRGACLSADFIEKIETKTARRSLHDIRAASLSATQVADRCFFLLANSSGEEGAERGSAGGSFGGARDILRCEPSYHYVTALSAAWRLTHLQKAWGGPCWILGRLRNLIGAGCWDASFAWCGGKSGRNACTFGWQVFGFVSLLERATAPPQRLYFEDFPETVKG